MPLPCKVPSRSEHPYGHDPEIPRKARRPARMPSLSETAGSRSSERPLVVLLGLAGSDLKHTFEVLDRRCWLFPGACDQEDFDALAPAPEDTCCRAALKADRDPQRICGPVASGRQMEGDGQLATTGGARLVLRTPTSGSVIAGTSVVVRGTVSPASATVQIQGQPAAVGNGVFTGTATLHGGKTTIDVIGSAPGATPGSTSVVVVQQSSGSSSKPSKKSPSEATPGVAHETSCGGGVSVGPDTTCVFAEDVESAYRRSGGESTVEAYSPVTEKFYEMTCVTSASLVTCTGGIGATVYFPL